MNQKRDLNNISRRRFGQTGVAAMLAAGAAPAFIGRASADEPKTKLGLAVSAWVVTRQPQLGPRFPRANTFG
jgi:hypothetical protein